MKIGFTGTREGMTEKQKTELKKQFKSLKIKEFHHGDCIGADEEAHKIFSSKYSNFKIYIHPPVNPSKRAYCLSDNIFPEKPYLERNKDIVDRCDLLIAAPKGKEEPRSGTWATVRYARKNKKKIVILH